MQVARRTKILGNLSTLAQLTGNFNTVFRSLLDKGLLNEAEQEEIASKGSSLNRKAGMYLVFASKQDSEYEALIDSLRSTGNDAAADVLESSSVQPSRNRLSSLRDSCGEDDAESILRSFQQVQIEAQIHIDQEIRANERSVRFTDQPEIILSRASTVSDSSEEPLPETPQETPSDVSIPPTTTRETKTTLEEGGSSTDDQDSGNLTDKSETTSEITSVPLTSPVEVSNLTDTKAVTEIPRIEDVMKPQKAKKQVQFNAPEEFLITKEERMGGFDSRRLPTSTSGKSLVQITRERFEKGNTGTGGGEEGATPFATYADNRSNGNVIVREKESNVKNLRSKFQN